MDELGQLEESLRKGRERRDEERSRLVVRKEAIKCKAETEARQEEVVDPFMQANPCLEDELKEREPTAADLERLCPEERSLVHVLRTKKPGSGPINWLALRKEVFRNKLGRIDYLMLAAVSVPESD
jgi:hypothetical protein